MQWQSVCLLFASTQVCLFTAEKFHAEFIISTSRLIVQDPNTVFVYFFWLLWKAYYVSHLPKARHICFILWFPLLKSILPEIPRLLCREDVLSTNPWCELGRSEASEGCFHVWLRYPAYRASIRKAPSWLPASVSLWAEFSFLPASPPDLSSEKPHCVPFL